MNITASLLTRDHVEPLTKATVEDCLNSMLKMIAADPIIRKQAEVMATIVEPFKREAALAVLTSAYVDKLTADIIDPFKTLFRATVEQRGEGYTYEIPGVGAIEGRLGTAAKAAGTRWVADPTKIKPETWARFVKAGAIVAEAIPGRKASAHAVSFKPYNFT